MAEATSTRLRAKPANCLGQGDPKGRPAHCQQSRLVAASATRQVDQELSTRGLAPPLPGVVSSRRRMPRSR